MANENGHIHAPVSIEDVKKVLGVRSNDVGTLCLSDKINPYSLIRPMPSDFQWAGVKDMKTMRLGDLPDGTTDMSWEYKQWGYQVPFVTNPNLIDRIKDLSWRRPPADIEHCKNLDHFDGYRHDVEPSFLWSVGEPIDGDPIVMMFAFGGEQTNIVSSSGKNNKGGVVSVREVFGDEPFYYGAEIKYGSTVRYISGGPVVPGQQTTGVIQSQYTWQGGTTYTITPYISNLSTSGTLPQGLRVYNLKFAPDFISTKTVRVPELTIAATVRVVETDTYTDPNTGLLMGTGNILKWEFILKNDFPYTYETSQLTATMVEHGKGEGQPGQYLYPRTTTRYIDAKELGLDSFRVEAKSTKVFEMDIPFMFYSSLTSTWAKITISGRIQRVPVGNAENFTTIDMRMYNPLYLRGEI